MARPSSFEAKFCKLLIAHMREGFGFESFAGVIDRAPSTIYKWVKEHPDFAEAKELAESHCLLFWEKIGIDNVRNKEFNTVLWIVNMCNRFGWRQRQKDDDDRDKNPGPSISMTAEQLVEITKKARGDSK